MCKNQNISVQYSSPVVHSSSPVQCLYLPVIFRAQLRHTVVCCAAQEAGTPHPWVSTKLQFSHTYTKLLDTLTKQNNFCSGNAGQCHHLTFQISTKSHRAFPRYEPSKIGLVSLFFFRSVYSSGSRTQLFLLFVQHFLELSLKWCGGLNALQYWLTEWLTVLH